MIDMAPFRVCILTPLPGNASGQHGRKRGDATCDIAAARRSRGSPAAITPVRSRDAVTIPDKPSMRLDNAQMDDAIPLPAGMSSA